MVQQIGAFADRLVLKLIQPSRLVGACGFRPIICMSTIKHCDRRCRFLAVRPEGANHQWRKISPENCRLIR